MGHILDNGRSRSEQLLTSKSPRVKEQLNAISMQVPIANESIKASMPHKTLISI